MTTFRELTFVDFFKLNRIFFDPFTEVYSLTFLITKILEFPMLAEVAVAPNEQLMGFAIGCRTIKDQTVDGAKDSDVIASHGHVSTLSIDHEFRRLGLGTSLLNRLNDYLELQRDWYVDLYVRSQNYGALKFYQLLGYENYRWLPRYYGDDNGLEMRMPLSRDINRICLNDGDSLTDMFYSAGRNLWLLLVNGLMRLKNTILDPF